MRRLHLYRFFNNAFHCTFCQRLFTFMTPSVCFKFNVVVTGNTLRLPNHGPHNPTLFTPIGTPSLQLAKRIWKRKRRNLSQTGNLRKFFRRVLNPKDILQNCHRMDFISRATLTPPLVQPNPGYMSCMSLLLFLVLLQKPTCTSRLPTWQAKGTHQQDRIPLEILELVFLVSLVISSVLVYQTRANELIRF